MELGYVKDGNVMGSFNIMPEIEENGKKDGAEDEYNDVDDRVHSMNTESYRLNELNFSRTTDKVGSE